MPEDPSPEPALRHPELSTSRATFAGVTVLTPAGRIDHTTSEAFRASIGPHIDRCLASGERVVLDLSRVDYISSAGLRAFMLAARQARVAGGPAIVLAALQPVVQEIFEISRFTLLFEIFPSVQAALEQVSPAAAAVYGRAAS